MDPNLFHIDGERLYEVLLAIVVLSFVLERALSLVFENRILAKQLSKKGLKELIAFGVAFLVCRRWDFDAVSVMLVSETTNGVGHALTAGVIAGGSKSSLKLFQDVMKTYSSAEAERREVKEQSKKPHPEEDLTGLAAQKVTLKAELAALEKRLAELKRDVPEVQT